MPSFLIGAAIKFPMPPRPTENLNGDLVVHSLPFVPLIKGPNVSPKFQSDALFCFLFGGEFLSFTAATFVPRVSLNGVQLCSRPVYGLRKTSQLLLGDPRPLVHKLPASLPSCHIVHNHLKDRSATIGEFGP